MGVAHWALALGVLFCLVQLSILLSRSSPAAPLAAARLRRSDDSSGTVRKGFRDPWADAVALQGVADGLVVPPHAVPPVRTAAAAPAAFAAPQPQAAASAAHVDYFCKNRARGDEETAAVDGASMTGFIASGGRFPILVVTCDRAEQLRRTLTALLAVRCVEPGDVLVVGDQCSGPGAAELPAIAASLGVAFHRNPRLATPAYSVPPDGAALIASAYAYALGLAFRVHATAPAIVVVEDDMAFSPDFYEYFHAVAPLLEADASLWLASAWHDNGFDYLVADPHALRRTRYFPGLGWLLPRAVWDAQLAASWPPTHWDHWLRDSAQHRGRDVLHPEVPRAYHMGVQGTFMDTGTHNKYFGSIAMAGDAAFSWDTAAGAEAIEAATLPQYEARVKAALLSPATIHLSSVAAIADFTAGEGVVWYSCPVGEPDHLSMRPLAAFFGIWHEGARGSRAGVHELWWRGTAKLWLVNVFAGYVPPVAVSGAVEVAPAWVRVLQPPTVRPLLASAFIGATRPQLPRHGSLFGARILSPLAHLEGGHDANGAPDTSGVLEEGDAAPKGFRRASTEDDPRHAHSRFLGDLRLERVGGDAALLPSTTSLEAHANVGSEFASFKGAVVVASTDSPGLSCDAVRLGLSARGGGISFFNLSPSLHPRCVLN